MTIKPHGLQITTHIISKPELLEIMQVTHHSNTYISYTHTKATLLIYPHPGTPKNVVLLLVEDKRVNRIHSRIFR